MIENACRYILTEAITTVGQRIYFGVAPQDCPLPRIVLGYTHTFNHNHDGNAGYQTGTITVEVFAVDYKAAVTLANEVVEVLDDYSGTVTIGAVATKIEWIEVVETTDIEVLPPTGDAKPKMAGVSIEFEFMIS